MRREIATNKQYRSSRAAPIEHLQSDGRIDGDEPHLMRRWIVPGSAGLPSEQIESDEARVVVSVVLDSVATGVGVGSAEVASSVRARVNRAVRHVFARNPDWRRRMKPRGRMCWTKRRRNSMAVSVIVRRASPCA
jgi:hypothetical protein